MNRQSGGFTLIEVLIALAITAIAAVIAYSGLDSSIKLAESAEKESDRIQKMNRVFDILSKDFRHIAQRRVRSPDGSDFVDALVFDELSLPMLQFSRDGWINPLPERFQRSQLQRVNYHFDDGKLIRYGWQMMDRYEDSERQEFVLLENVRSFQVRALTYSAAALTALPGTPAAGGTSWVKSWPPNGASAVSSSKPSLLPIALEVSIDIEGWGEVRRIFELVSSGS